MIEMVNESIVTSVRDYLRELVRQGVPVDYGVVFGSQVNGRAHEWSDIDLIVVSPRFDVQRPWEEHTFLWRVAARVDSRIEPVAVGQRQFEDDDSSALIEIARREGQKVLLDN
ncbi:MAG: nucleotidyltransferase domain-containing protein [Planctomycetes bacterium]|nr:nucleotidyltransferase domain-containing protein [Planctomycetota bacterium]MBM4083883.1 nucleotidyltransferase domain-containing protein [Planctomycetota bacterium]